MAKTVLLREEGAELALINDGLPRFMSNLAINVRRDAEQALCKGKLNGGTGMADEFADRAERRC